MSKCVPLTPFQGSCLDPPHEGGTSLARGLSCIKMNKSTFCLYREKILKVHNSNVLEKNPLLICLAGIFCIFSRWIMFRHSSDLIVCCPAVLTLRQCGLLVASVPPVCQCAGFGNTPACSLFSDKIEAFSSWKTALRLARFLKSPPH